MLIPVPQPLGALLFPYFPNPRRAKLRKKFHISKEEGHLFQDALLLYKI
jgi:hypothetical protein